MGPPALVSAVLAGLFSLCTVEKWGGACLLHRAWPFLSHKEKSIYNPPSRSLFPLQSIENSGDQSHKMPTTRCVRLTLVSAANDLKEAWISDHPYLAVCYLWQYAPTWAWWLMNRMGKRRIQNFKSGVVSLFLSPLLACFLFLLCCQTPQPWECWDCILDPFPFSPPPFPSSRCQARLRRCTPGSLELLWCGDITEWGRQYVLQCQRSGSDLHHMGCKFRTRH